jgi:Restriction endonuclease/TIR domain
VKVFVAHSLRDRDFVEILARELRENQHEVNLPSDLTFGSNISSEISATVRSADIFIAVVTSANSNIFYEIGLAAGANVPMLIAASAHESLPFDIASVPYVRLTGNDTRDAQIVVHRVKDLQSEVSKKAPEFDSAEATLQAAARDPQVLESLGPIEFERLIGQLLKDRGFAVESLGAGRDVGADFAIKSDTGNEVALVEVKKLSRQSRVPVEAVRNLLSAVSRTGVSRGLLVSTAGYTAAALALAEGAPILLRTLKDVLAAKSLHDLLGDRESDG